MNTISLFAVDEPKTTCREDAFFLERFPDGSVWRLTVASVIPPENARINYKHFRSNIFSQEGDPHEYFLKQRDYVKFGLHTKEPRRVLMTIFEFDKNRKLVVKVTTGDAVIEAFTYETFSSRQDFENVKSGIEEFLSSPRHLHINWKYKSREGEQYWKEAVTPARRLISALLNMFNRAVSQYAHNEGLLTLKRTRHNGLRVELHSEAKFRAPLRRAISFVNILNITASIEGASVPYPCERLWDILGDIHLSKT